MREEQVNIVARVTAFLEKQLFVERSDVKKGDLSDSLEQPPCRRRRPEYSGRAAESMDVRMRNAPYAANQH